jgi:hypothetical protein
MYFGGGGGKNHTHFCGLAHPFSTSMMVTTFKENIQKLDGNPKIIVSVRDPIFTSIFGRNCLLLWVLNYLTNIHTFSIKWLNQDCEHIFGGDIYYFTSDK